MNDDLTARRERPLHFVNLGPGWGGDGSTPVIRRTEYVPEWLDDKMARRILTALYQLKGANPVAKIIILVPIHLVPLADRVHYEGAMLFGHEARLDGYIPDVVVGIVP